MEIKESVSIPHIVIVIPSVSEGSEQSAIRRRFLALWARNDIIKPMRTV